MWSNALPSSTQSLYVFWKAHVITSIRIEEKKARVPNFWTIVKKNVMKRQQAGKRCFFKFILRVDRFIKPILKIVNVYASNFQGGIHFFYIHVYCHLGKICYVNLVSRGPILPVLLSLMFLLTYGKKEQTGWPNYALLFPVFCEETTLTGAFKSDELTLTRKESWSNGFKMFSEFQND